MGIGRAGSSKELRIGIEVGMELFGVFRGNI
jgi:hypothetical protein